MDVNTRSILTIRNTLFAAVGVLALLIMGLSSFQASDAYERSANAARGRESNEISELLLASAGNWAVERGVTNAALAAENPVDDALRQIIDDRRAAADPAFLEALDRLEQGSAFEHREQLIDAARTHYTTVVALRQRADDALAQTKAQREIGDLDHWVPGMTALIMASQDLRLGSQYQGDTVETRIAAIQGLQTAAWVMSEFAGRERAVVGATLSSATPIGGQKLTTLAEYRGRVEQAWFEVQAIIGRDGIDPTIVDAAAAVQADFFTTFQETRDAVYAAGMAGQPYPLDTEEWISRSTTAIDTILALGRAVADVADSTNAALEHEGSLSFIAGLGMLIIAALISGLALWIVAARTVGPIARLTGVMGELAGGNKTVAIPFTGRRDEIGDIARSVEVFKANAVEMDRLEQERIAAEQRSEDEKRSAMRALADSFEGSVKVIVDGVTGSSRQVSDASTAMSETAELTKAQAGNVASASAQARSNVEAVAAAAEELSASIGEIGRHVSSSTEIATRAVKEAESASGDIAHLTGAANKIGDVVNLIQEIAEQTNLLALNATIEAARAGDAGKGFAVVASEVKALAQQTARATEEISSHVQQMQQETTSAVGAIDRISGVISEIHESAGTIASAVEEQSASTQEIARNVHEAANGAKEVAGSIEEVSAAAQQSGESAGLLRESSQELSQQADRLNQEVTAFLERVRAA